MMNIFNRRIEVSDINKMEKLLNVFKVGLNNWNRSEAYSVNGKAYVNYTIRCSENTFVGIMSGMYVQGTKA